MAGAGDEDARGTADRGIGDESRSTGDYRGTAIPPTRTSGTTEAPPLDQRPQPPIPFGRAIACPLDVFVLAGTPYDPHQQVAAASRIWWQCGVELHIANLRVYDEAATRRLLSTRVGDAEKPLTELPVEVSVDEETVAMKALRAEWLALRQRSPYAVFFAAKVYLRTNGAPAAADPGAQIVYIGPYDAWPGWVLAHELGHHWIAPGHYGLESDLMHPNRPGDEVSKSECGIARRRLDEALRRHKARR